MDTIHENDTKQSKKQRNFLNNHATLNRKNLQAMNRMNKRAVTTNMNQIKEMKRKKGYNASLETGEKKSHENLLD